MPSSIRPIIVTHDLERLLAFYTGLLGAEELTRFPDDGPVFYVEALLPRVGALGGTATSGANDMPWGQRVAHVADPDGNLVNLTQQL
jgi:catechol 2,3-dioxygenase-like lactoylglutathione lyase family enzyme